MIYKHPRSFLLFLLLTVGMLYGCSKDKFLDKKPDTRLVIPTTLTEMQALLDNQPVMKETPELGELSSDNYYLLYSTWTGLTTKYQNAYTWAEDTYKGQGKIPDYNNPYQQVFYANVVIDGLRNLKVDESAREDYNRVWGMALFIRAYAFYNLAQIFAPVYDGGTASKDNGIVLRLTSDVNAPSVRASVEDTYNRILSDLLMADSLMPESVPNSKLNRPCRAAVQAMLARVYLSMSEYPQAGMYADNSLQLYDSLIEYRKYYVNGIAKPFIQLSPEVLYQSNLVSTSEVLVGGGFKTVCVVDTNLYNSYKTGDLRRFLYYRGSSSTSPHYLRYNYSGYPWCFSGLAVDEVMLIRAECAARAGNKNAALDDLNKLLSYRWVDQDSMLYLPITATSREAALDSILLERRKELAFRGLRWTDLRRLNKENANISITHGLNGQLYNLPTNSPNYVYDLPPDVTGLGNSTAGSHRVQIDPK